MARTIFIVGRDHQNLYEYLTERFAGDEAVTVILDRRRGERRSTTRPQVPERRRGERRRHPEVDAELRTRSHAVVTVD